MFDTYFILGLDHIANLKGYDHIIFLVTLCATFSIAEWKKVLILVTAFTLGHTATLALATLEVVTVNATLIEILIPVTILITAISNIVQKKNSHFMWLQYSFALFFGLIHGLGFSNYLRMLLTREQGIAMPLFGFNVGVEAGQILIVVAIMLISALVLRSSSFAKRDWVMLLSGIGLGTSVIMIIDRLPI